MKQFERTYENIDFILFKAYYIEGKSVDVAVSLREQEYMIEYIGADNRVRISRLHFYSYQQGKKI